MMAYWRKNDGSFDEMQQLIDQHPGMTATELARLLDVAPSTVQRRLPSMEEAGYLLAEDDRGGLWSFFKKKG